MHAGAGYGFKQLLLLFLISSELPNIQTRSTDFVCNARVRRNMNNLKDLEVAMVGCSGSDQLPSTLQLPCVGILKASWDQKSLQQKHAEVKWGLQVLLDSVGRVRELAKLSCQSSLLERLKHRVKNNLHIVTDLDTMGEEEAAVSDPNPDCLGQRSNSLTQVLHVYDRLLRGKLEWLFLDLQNSCL
uniref:Thrombopoietin n=1 Tax=Esox lucius TaxID=8010 RepID=A0A3P8YG03_ESOLU